MISEWIHQGTQFVEVEAKDPYSMNLRNHCLSKEVYLAVADIRWRPDDFGLQKGKEVSCNLSPTAQKLKEVLYFWKCTPQSIQEPADVKQKKSACTHYG